MKKSIAFLPKKNREDLKYIVSLIREKIPQCEMIILFGSYARGTFVAYDERVEFGVTTIFKSDYDILVVHSAEQADVVESGLWSVRSKFGYHFENKNDVPLQIIHDHIKKFSQDITDGRYFFTEVKQDGIMLYDSGNYKLPRRRKPRFGEIKEQAEEYYADRVDRAARFLRDAKYTARCKDYTQTSFYLHQACENFFHAISLVYTLKAPKEHNLEKLYKATRGYAPELHTLFPLDIPEEKRVFELLLRAYVEARYNPKFSVAKEDAKTIMQKTEALGEIVRIAYERRIKEYEEKSKASS